MSKELPPLRGQMLKFCHEYVVDCIGEKAALRAKYAPASARFKAAKLLKDPRVREKIAELKADQAARTNITADKVMVELARIGLLDVRQLFTEDGALLLPHNMPDEVAKVVQSLEVVSRPTGEKDDDGNPIIDKVYKVRLADKNRALEALAKHFELLVNHTVIKGQLEHEHRHTVVSDETKSVLEQLAGHGERTGDTTPSTH